ncbi:hypothetical protein NBRC3293_1434 [Gluconobacter oxydans NBRC 3293]|uniref:Uncharacterized protein n=1 Tax=Gluconobacter oxydans NBRC 3293 TaxID=1315969 RepID=A0A829X265_GLUOY|nr:hypothetical protein NBRC3293_1434 [Gluconobacter oxydans NBRC 3293]
MFGTDSGRSPGERSEYRHEAGGAFSMELVKREPGGGPELLGAVYP